MDEKHSSVPPFERSADAHESWRQQQIAALTPNQRKSFDELRIGQTNEHDQLKHKQQENYKDRVAEQTRRYLLQNKNLNYRPKDQRSGFVSKQDEIKMLKDFLGGKNTPAVLQNRERLQSAQQKAVGAVQTEQKNERENLESRHQKDQDKFLKNAEKDRERAKEKTSEYRGDFTNASDEKAWKKAMDLAKQKEENQHDRDDRNKDDRTR